MGNQYNPTDRKIQIKANFKKELDHALDGAAPHEVFFFGACNEIKFKNTHLNL